MNKSPQIPQIIDNRKKFLLRDHDNQSLDYMDFGSALDEVIKGKKVRRLSWEDPKEYLAILDVQLLIFRSEDQMLHPLTVSTGDITGNDWIVLPEDKDLN